MDLSFTQGSIILVVVVLILLWVHSIWTTNQYLRKVIDEGFEKAKKTKVVADDND